MCYKKFDLISQSTQWCESHKREHAEDMVIFLRDQIIAKEECFGSKWRYTSWSTRNYRGVLRSHCYWRIHEQIMSFLGHPSNRTRETCPSHVFVKRDHKITPEWYFYTHVAREDENPNLTKPCSELCKDTNFVFLPSCARSSSSNRNVGLMHIPSLQEKNINSKPMCRNSKTLMMRRVVNSNAIAPQPYIIDRKRTKYIVEIVVWK